MKIQLLILLAEPISRSPHQNNNEGSKIDDLISKFHCTKNEVFH